MAIDLVVSASLFNPALHPDEILIAFRNSMPTTVANFNGEKAEETFEEFAYSSFAIINKEELLGEWQAFKRAVSMRRRL